jgi:predicted double-glycine peptidase
MKEGDRSTKNIKVKNAIFLLSSFVVLTVLIIFSCSPIHDTSVSRSEKFIEDVPFYRQETYQCGPASLAGVLNYWGVDVKPQDIAGEIFSKSARGTLNIDMVLYAQSKGLRAQYYRGNRDDIEKKISDGFPLIVLVDFGFLVYQVNHFMVIIGFNEDAVVVNSGKHQGKFLSWRDFEKAWEKANYWTLFVSPE